MADSLRVLALLEELPEGPCIDVGSGAGLPGIPLAIASGRHWRLLEPRRPRAAFLEEVVRTLDLDCEVVTMPAEEAAQDPALRGAHACATARAVAEPAAAFELLLPFVAPAGRATLWIGKKARIPREAVVWKEGIATMTPS